MSHDNLKNYITTRMVLIHYILHKHQIQSKNDMACPEIIFTSVVVCGTPEIQANSVVIRYEPNLVK